MSPDNALPHTTKKIIWLNATSEKKIQFEVTQLNLEQSIFILSFQNKKNSHIKWIKKMLPNNHRYYYDHYICVVTSNLKIALSWNIMIIIMRWIMNWSNDEKYWTFYFTHSIWYLCVCFCVSQYQSGGARAHELKFHEE